MKGVKRFDKKGKLNPRYVNPYKILSHFEKVVYELELPSDLASVHPVFLDSLLKKCIGDPAIAIPLESVDIQNCLSYEEVPVEILDHQIRRLRNKEVPLVKVLWRNQSVEGATWEAEARALESIPHPRQQVNDYSEEVCYLRILRWFSAKKKSRINPFDLINPPNDGVVHLYLVPTEQDLKISDFLTLRIVETKPELKVDLIKKKLAGATTIKREAPREGEFVFVEPVVEFFGDSSIDLDIGVNISDGDVIGVGGGNGDHGLQLLREAPRSWRVAGVAKMAFQRLIAISPHCAKFPSPSGQFSMSRHDSTASHRSQKLGFPAFSFDFLNSFTVVIPVHETMHVSLPHGLAYCPLGLTKGVKFELMGDPCEIVKPKQMGDFSYATLAT
ncbi:putative uroporphyrinogen decarboxylase, chloroplastic-like [Capsicum annuum]|nr:putative uroporphyrinogen decarboxylase, chloroplastic-like [Capsicum annuum]